MSWIDLEDLLRPVSDAAPAGENLEYSSEFMSLERAAQGKPEQRMGNAVVPGEPPDARLVLEQSVALLQRTKDVRAAVHAVHALLQRGGLEGIHDGLALVRALLERFWPSLHPQLDREDNDDPTMRVTALAALSTPSLLASLRSLPLVRSPLGSVALKDLQAAGSGGADGTTIDAVFQSAELASVEAAATWLGQSIAHLSAIDGVFETESHSRGPDLTALVQVFRDAFQLITPRVQALRPVAAGQPQDSPGAQSSRPAPGAGSRGGLEGGEIASREDVLRTLDKLCAYYARFEPSSPLPLLLLRCKRLVPMTFVDIIRELAPEGLGQIETIAGKGGA